MNMFPYGPFNIPKKDKWVIVGSGPSAENYLDIKDAGIISVGGNICRIENTTINMQVHFETVFNSIKYFDNAEIIYLCDPMYVGLSCIPIEMRALFDCYYLESKFGNKIRKWTRRIEMQKNNIDYSFYAKETIATAGLELLKINGIKECYFCGIDGGYGHSKIFQDVECYNDETFRLYSYDTCRKDFLDYAKFLGMEIKELKGEKVLC